MRFGFNKLCASRPNPALLSPETSHDLISVVLLILQAHVLVQYLSSALQGCGFRLYHHLKGLPLKGMPASNLAMSFEPSLHVFCQDANASALKPFRSDGLPKYKDLPKEGGGSGDTLQL